MWSDLAVAFMSDSLDDAHTMIGMNASQAVVYKVMTKVMKDKWPF